MFFIPISTQASCEDCSLNFFLCVSAGIAVYLSAIGLALARVFLYSFYFSVRSDEAEVESVAVPPVKK